MRLPPSKSPGQIPRFTAWLRPRPSLPKALAWRFLLAILVVLIAPSLALAAGEAKLLPVDDGPKDPSFLAFREKLMDALRKRHTAFVLQVLDPHIKNDFGGSEGIQEFKEKWAPEKPESRLWPTLLTILSMGGSYAPSESEPKFWAPYVFSRWPDEFDAFEYAAITGKNVNVRSAPAATGQVIGQLSYDIVKVLGELDDADRTPEDESNGWVKIVTPSGEEGYVSRRYIRSPIDYRAGFVKREGKWRMNILIAGD